MELDAGEMAVAQVLAAMRNGINRASGVANKRIGPQSDYQTDLDGLVAEIAFAKWRNVAPDLSVRPRAGSADAVVDKARVDVKSTRRKDGRLLAARGKATHNDVDIYVLAIVEDNVVNFPGWAKASDLLKDENLIDLGHGKGYAMTQEQLRPFKDSPR